MNKGSRERLSSEIEITPAMIEAGTSPLVKYRREHGNEREVLIAIYKAMTAAMD